MLNSCGKYITNILNLLVSYICNIFLFPISTIFYLGYIGLDWCIIKKSYLINISLKHTFLQLFFFVQEKEIYDVRAH